MAMNLRDFNIGTRLSIGFGSILLILVAMVLAANFFNYSNKSQLTKGLQLSTAKSLQAATMKSAMLETGIAMRNIGLQSDVNLMQKEEAKVQDQRKRYDAASAQLKSLGLNDTETDAAFKEAIGQVLAFNSEGAAKVISGRIDPLNQQTLALINKLVDLQQVAAKDVMEGSASADARLMLILFVMGAVAVAVGVVGAIVITRSITVPLAGALDVAQKVAAGELTARSTSKARTKPARC